jgi:hypothetical protein
MELVGICKQLTALREERGISPEEVSAATRIPITVLRKIESCEALSTTPRVYLKGFLKLYAQFLHANDLSDQIENAFSPASEKKTARREQPMPASEAKPAPVTRPAAQPASTRPQPGTSHLMPESPQLRVDASAQREKKSLVKPVIIGIMVFAAVAGFKSMTSKKTPVPETKSTEDKAPAKSAAPSTAEISASVPDLKPVEAQTPEITPLPGIENAENVFVDLITTGNIFVSVRSDGELVFRSLLLNGARETWSANGMIEIRISDPSAVRLEILGKQIPTDNRNKPTTYVITPEGFYTKK